MREIRLRTERRTELVEITRQVREVVAGERGSAVLVYVPHTTAGVTINEHADPAVARDLESSHERIVDDGWPWEHVEPGEENAPAHVRASLVGSSVLVPLVGVGSIELGKRADLVFLNDEFVVQKVMRAGSWLD